MNRFETSEMDSFDCSLIFGEEGDLCFREGDRPLSCDRPPTIFFHEGLWPFVMGGSSHGPVMAQVQKEGDIRMRTLSQQTAGWWTRRSQAPPASALLAAWNSLETPLPASLQAQLCLPPPGLLGWACEASQSGEKNPQACKHAIFRPRWT